MAVDPVSLAVTAALTAANMALSAMQTFEGPRIKATPATVADYGTPLNYFLGTRLMNCPCFFAKPIREERKQRKGKGGKQVTYTGYGSFAVHIADQEIGGVLQVWFDNHLVYDNTGSSEKLYPLADDYELEAHMRVYLGTEVQDPDPDMLAYIEARDGAGTCPAYRGTSYLYFEDIPLEMLGNRYPDVKVMATSEDGVMITAPEEEILFVGSQVLEMVGDVNGAGSGVVNFALTGGLASVPAAGDTVLIAAVTGYLDTGPDENPVVSGYTQLATVKADDSSGFLALCLSLFAKRMGDTPDTTWEGFGTGASEDATAWIVAVFREVHEDILDVPVVIRSEYTSDSNVPDPVTLANGQTVNPGTFATFISPAAQVSFTVALKSESTEQNLILVLGSKLLGTDVAGWVNAPFPNALGVAAADAVAATAGMAWGETIMLGAGSSLGTLLTLVSQRANLGSDEYDYSAVFGEDHAFDGFNWTQGSGRQICEAMCDLFDVDLRPHEFTVQALPRGSTSAGAIPTTEFVANETPYTIPDTSEVNLPARVFLTYADTTAEQNPNVAMPQGGESSGGEVSIDMQTLALTPTRAQQLTERRQRRERFGRVSAEFGLTRQRFEIEPGDVYTPSFDGEPMVMRCAKITIGADGRFPTEWKRDDPAIAGNPSSVGAPAVGIIPDTIPDGVDSVGYVLDTAYLIDAHDQSAPLAYLAAGPAEPGIWTGADYALSDTGDLDSYAQGWDGIPAGAGSVIGTVAGTLPDVEYPWMPDLGSSISVTINAGELTAATLDELILDGTRNLAAIRSGDGWELVQFMTPTLTGTLTYTITGFLRGVRGTEWAIAGHASSDAFVLLDNAKVRTLGASEIGDEDFYVVSTVGAAVDQTEAFSVDYTGASHKPYSPVHGVLTFDTGVSDDITIDAERRTRIGGSTLDGQDVPLGEASESWSADIYDGVTFKRTITGTSLPLTWTAAEQTTDFGSPVTTGFEVYLYQVNPTLSLRGYPLALAA